MSLSAIARPNFLFDQNPFMSALKTGVLAFALNTIQQIGVFARNTSSTHADSDTSTARFWQEHYTSRVNILTEKHKMEGAEWIWPKTEQDWERLLKLQMQNFHKDLICDALAYAASSWNPLRWGAPQNEQEAASALHSAFCQYRAYYKTLFNCRGTGSDLIACINKDPKQREDALKSLAAAIETVLPLNAEESKYMPVKDCLLTTDCPDIDKAKLDPREQQAAETAYTTKPLHSKRERLENWLASHFSPPEWTDVQEVLRFRKDDLREKFLFIAVDKDDTDRPALNPQLISGILSKLSQKFDLKYVVLKRHADICKLVDSAKKTGNLGFVLINGHGNAAGITFDADDVISPQGKTRWKVHDEMTEYFNFAECFSGIKPNGKILLLSCTTGGMKNIGTWEQPVKSGRPFDNIAQKIADAAKRVVIAPKDLAHPTLTNLIENDHNDVGLYEPASLGRSLFSLKPFYNTNLYESFRPHFKQCYPELDKRKLHTRELLATTVIRNDLIEKSLLHEEEPLVEANEYLQLCKDDPREKVLVLSAHHDKNGALNPSLHTKILSLFADRFDLRYKLIESFEDICREVKNASHVGKVITLVVQGHGTASDGMIFAIKEDEKRLSASNDFTKCFSGVDKDGTIVLMGSSLGQNGSNENNIAQKIANDTKRTVLATTCPIFPSDTNIQSIDPLILNHPGYSGVYNFLFMGCSENDDNHFKTFYPKNLKPANFNKEL